MATTPHTLEENVGKVKRRVRRLSLLYGGSVSVAVVGGAAFLLGLTDYLFRFHDPGIRFLSSLGFLVLLVWGLYRFLLPVLRFRLSNGYIAQRIEQRYPNLENRLSSAIYFLAQSEHETTAGSAELRRAVVAQTTSESERLDFGACVDAGRPRRAAMIAAAVCVLVIGACSLDFASTTLAARRLAMPWRQQPWPRRHVLQFVTPATRLAAGSDFEAAVVDQNGSLPDTVEFQIWWDDSPANEIQTKAMKFLSGKMVHRLENVTRSFRYRAVGGDDISMPWLHLEVVEPPRVLQHTIRLHPPAYTGWDPYQADESFTALEGTRVEVRGQLDKPVASVSLRSDQPNDPLSSVPVALDEDGTSLTISPDSESAWTVLRSHTYRFETVDPEGLVGEGSQRWSVRAVRDVPPSVSLERPSGNTFVTADGFVRLGGAAKDDLAIASIRLLFQRSDRSEQPQDSVELFAGPPIPGSDTQADSVGERDPLTAATGDKREIDFVWDLSQIADLQAGTFIDFHVEASDYRPQSGQSTPRRLTIISAAELEDRIASRQTFILSQLAEVLRVQQETRSQTRSLEIQLDEANQFKKSDVDQLQSAELNQRRVARLLADPQDGVVMEIERLLDELANNRVDSPEIAERMRELLLVVSDIARRQLPEISRQLVGTLKIARTQANDDGSSPYSQAARDSLRTAGQDQDQVIARLEELLGDLSQWDTYRRFSREVSRIRQDQTGVEQATEQIRLDTLGKAAADLTTQERADLKRLAERQAELADRFEQIKNRMEQMRQELQQADPAAAETLADALDAARRGAIAGGMRESSRDIESNRVGQSLDRQKRIGNDLQEVLDTLANRREHELKRRLEKLDEAADDLKGLLKKQKQLADEMERAAKEPDLEQRKRELQRLSRQQRELAEESKRMSRRLQRLQAENAAGLSEQAADQQQAAGDAGEAGEAQRALEESRNAEKSLEEANRQLAETRQQTRQDLQREQMLRLQHQIRGLVVRQRAVVELTAEMQEMRESQNGKLTRGQLTTVGDLANRQRALAFETGELAESLAYSEAFTLGLRGATREMLRAAKFLETADVGPQTLAAERTALLRLEQLHGALQQDAQENGNTEGQQPNQPGQNGTQQDLIQRLAELKLLKLMQEEINRRTIELNLQRTGDGDLTEGQLRELSDLAKEQGELAELLSKFSEAAVAEPKDPAAPEPSNRDSEELDDLDKALLDELLR